MIGRHSQTENWFDAMMKFDEIWPHFSWVIEEMRDGMGFFEGYITSIGENNLLVPLSKLIWRARSHSFTSSAWSDETTEADRERDYDAADYVAFFDSGRIAMLDFEYEFRAGNADLDQKLMFDRDEAGTALEIICFRDAILSSPEPKQVIADAISEFRHLKHLFQGDALFLGPDTLDYPQSATDYPRAWLKIE